MGLLEQASLVITPTAVKAGKLYSVIPTNGAGDLDVVRATSATRVNSAGLIETVGNNIARLDYSNGSCPSILVEPQRTNLFVRSEEFNDSSWTKASLSVTPKTTLSPTGFVNADTITSTGNVDVMVLGLLTLTSNTAYSISFYVKQNTQRFVYVRLTSNSITQNYVSVVFDLQDGTIGQTSVGTTSGTLISSDIRDVGNGFYRVSITASINATNGNIGIGFATAKTSNTFNAFGTITSTITIGNSIFLWGAQLEEGSNATSYIPTTTATVTRNADIISNTNASTLIGQTEGCLFLDFVPTTVDSTARYISVSNSSSVSNGWFGIFASASTNTFRFYGEGFDVNIGTLILNNRYKIVLNYKNGVVTKIFINGVNVSTITANNTGKSYNFIQLATAPIGTRGNANFNCISLFKNIISDQQAIQLTTL